MKKNFEGILDEIIGGTLRRSPKKIIKEISHRIPNPEFCQVNLLNVFSEVGLGVMLENSHEESWEESQKENRKDSVWNHRKTPEEIPHSLEENSLKEVWILSQQDFSKNPEKNLSPNKERTA